MSAHGSNYAQWWCKPCGTLFPTWEALREHKHQQRLAGARQHVQCSFCGQDFDTEEAELKHIQQNHAKDQHLECPACKSGPYFHLGGLVGHIEKKECPRLDVERLDQLREDKLRFTRQIQDLTQNPIKYDYSSFVSGQEPPAQAQSWNTNENQDRTASALAQDMTRGGWGAEGNTTTHYSTSVLFQGLEAEHPDHPAFDISRYYSPHTQKFHCPKPLCTKGFARQGALRGHLLSPAHGGRTYRCPYCHDSFKSLTAVTQHAESAGTRCRLRDWDNFESYIDQLTAGLVEVLEGRHDDGSPMYQITKTARDIFSAGAS